MRERVFFGGFDLCRLAVGFSALMGALTASPLSSHAACVPGASGLISWWSFDGELGDATTRNPAVAEGNPSFVSGLVDLALELDGVDDRVLVAAGPTLDVGAGTGGMTIEGWFKPQDPAAQRPLVEWSNGRGDAGVHLWVSQGYNGAPGDLYANLIDRGGTAHPVVSDPGLITARDWYHAAVTYDRASGTVALYLNGISRSSGIIGSFALHTSYQLFFGERGSIRFAGALDEWALYNRALSATEVGAIFNAGSAGRCKTAIAPSITTQPADQTIYAGETASLGIVAYGSAPLTFQWLKDGQPIADATNAFLNIPDAPLTASGSYEVQVTNLAGALTSRAAILTVREAPPCLPSPAGLLSWWPFDLSGEDRMGVNPGQAAGSPALGTGKVGGAILFDGVDDSVFVAQGTWLDVGAGAGMTVEGWFRPQDPYAQKPLVEWNNRQGALGVHLWVSQSSNGDLFANLIDVNGGSHHVQSAAGLVTSNTWYHLALTYNRASGVGTIYLNGVSVAQQAVGSFALQTSYDLLFGRRVHGGGSTWFQGAMDEWGLYIRALSALEVGQIHQAGPSGRCKVPSAPLISIQPASQAIVTGETVTFRVTAFGSAPLAFQWLKNGQPLPGATTATLTIPNATAAASGSYSVRVSNSAGAVTSDAATLMVWEVSQCLPKLAGSISWWPFDRDALDSFGINPGVATGSPALGVGKVELGITFDGVDDDISVRAGTALDAGTGAGMTVEGWFRPQQPFAQMPLVEWNNRQGASGVHLWMSQSGNGDLFANLIDVNNASHHVQSSGGLVISNTWYHVALTYDRGSGIATIYLNGTPVAQQTIGNVALRTSYDLFFGRRIHGGGSVWFQGAMDEWALFSRAISPLEVDAIYQSGMIGRCRIPLPPYILSQPTGALLLVGDTVELSVSAIAGSPLTFQWMRGNQPVPGATGETLNIPNATVATSGNYVVVVTGAGGSATSQVAVVSVIPPPPCVTPPSGLVGWWSFDEGTEALVGPSPAQFAGGPTVGPAWVGAGLFLDGVDDSSWVSAGAHIDLGKKPGLTIECWIKPENVDSQQPIVEWNNRVNSLGLHFWISQGGAGGPGSLYANLVDTTGASHGIHSPGGLLRSNQWEHVALTYDQTTGNGALYLNGRAVAEHVLGVFTPQTSVPYDLLIGERIADGASYRYTGGLDELSLYARALSAEEMWSVSRLGRSAGKCKDGFPPLIASGPRNLVVGRGATARFDVVVNGSRPLSFEWLFNGSPLPGATQAALILSNIIPSDAGLYSVTVSNLSGRATSSQASLVVKPPATVVQAGQVAARPGTKATVPLTALVQGTEHSLAFSLAFDPAKLAFAGATLAPGLPVGTALTLATNDAGSGKVGLRIALPIGASLSPGTHVLAQVEYVVALSATEPSLGVGFGNQPFATDFRESSGNTLLSTFVPGEVRVILPRVRVVSLDAAAADIVEVPIELSATGTENALGFSLHFDSTKLTFVDVLIGPDVPAGSALFVNTNAASEGRVGLGVALPANTTVPVGTARLFAARFRVGLLLSPETISIEVGDSPTPRQVSDQLAARLPAEFSGGTIHVVSFEFEGDVSPRPAGDRSVGVTDWTQVGRYAGAFDVPTAEEFPRADCAPLDTRGNGQISIADWVQAGRFYAGLDLITARGGPLVPDPPPAGGGNVRAAAARSVRLLDQRVRPGDTFAIPIALTAQGDENAFGFSVQFDPAVLEFVGYTNGPELSQTLLSVNQTRAEAGTLGVTMGLQLGTAISSGNWQLLRLSFRARTGVDGTTGVSFVDQPVLREVVDVRARVLSASFLDGTVSFGPPLVVGPRLDLVRSGPNLVFLWPTSSTNFDLEMTSQLPSPNWVKVGIAPVQLGAQNIVSLAMTNAQQYFRLRHP